MLEIQLLEKPGEGFTFAEIMSDKITNMKSTLFTLLFCSLLTFSAIGQRVALVDVTVVLESLPDYQAAQKEFDDKAAEWRQEIAVERDKIKSLYNKYQADLVMLSDEAKTQRENEIMEKEKQLSELQRERFGPDGLLFKKREELVQPIQEKVFDAIESYANDRGYDLILDKGGSAAVLFSSDELDKTEDIKKRLGLRE